MWILYNAVLGIVGDCCSWRFRKNWSWNSLLGLQPVLLHLGEGTKKKQKPVTAACHCAIQAVASRDLCVRRSVLLIASTSKYNTWTKATRYRLCASTRDSQHTVVHKLQLKLNGFCEIHTENLNAPLKKRRQPSAPYRTHTATLRERESSKNWLSYGRHWGCSSNGPLNSVSTAHCSIRFIEHKAHIVYVYYHDVDRWWAENCDAFFFLFVVPRCPAIVAAVKVFPTPFQCWPSREYLHAQNTLWIDCNMWAWQRLGYDGFVQSRSTSSIVYISLYE